MKIWAKTKELSEGKYLVVRRDGTILTWPHFVLGGNDPSTPTALRAYAEDAKHRGLDAEYIASILELADDFAARDHSEADPDSGPHRKDQPAVIKLMRGHGDLTRLIDRDALQTLTRTWNDGTATIVERVKYLSYDRGGLFSDCKAFLYVHGEEGTPKEIFRIDDRLRHMKLEAVTADSTIAA